MSKDKRSSTSTQAQQAPAAPSLDEVFADVQTSVERFCLLAGIEVLQDMMEQDARKACGGQRYARNSERQAYRWGTTTSVLGYQGGKVSVQRPRVRTAAGKEVTLSSWEELRDPAVLQQWAFNMAVLNVSTRGYSRATRPPEGDVPADSGDGTSRSAVSRRFVAMSRRRFHEWLQADLSQHDLVILQIDGLEVGETTLVAAIGIDSDGRKHVLSLADGATENKAVVQALLDDLVARGLDPSTPRLFVVDGAKALSKAISNTFGANAAIQRCQIHKSRNILDRLPESKRPAVRKALRQAWEQDDPQKAERLLRNLANRLEHEAPGVSSSILEGLDEMLTVVRLGLPWELRRSLACTNIIENALGTVRRVTANVKRWRDAEMAMRWTATGLLEANRSFRRLKAYKQIPALRARLEQHCQTGQPSAPVENEEQAA